MLCVWIRGPMLINPVTEFIGTTFSAELVQVHTSLPASSTDSLSPPHKSTSAPLLQPQGARIYVSESEKESMQVSQLT